MYCVFTRNNSTITVLIRTYAPNAADKVTCTVTFKGNHSTISVLVRTNALNAADKVKCTEYLKGIIL